MTGLRKQAKTLTEAQLELVLSHLKTKPNNIQMRTMVLLSHYAGLRACEIAALEWTMLTDAQGALTGELRLPNIASKGRCGGRWLPLHRDLVDLLRMMPRCGSLVFLNRSGKALTPNTVAQRFKQLYVACGLEGCSSHSGRRGFATRLAKDLGGAGASLRDLQQLMGHASLGTTEAYLVAGEQAKRRLVAGLTMRSEFT